MACNYERRLTLRLFPEWHVDSRVATGFAGPIATTLDSRDNIFVSAPESGNSGVFRFAPDGRQGRFSPPGLVWIPRGVDRVILRRQPTGQHRAMLLCRRNLARIFASRSERSIPLGFDAW